jgi:hypothetical protein
MLCNSDQLPLAEQCTPFIQRQGTLWSTLNALNSLDRLYHIMYKLLNENTERWSRDVERDMPRRSHDSDPINMIDFPFMVRACCRKLNSNRISNFRYELFLDLEQSRTRSI